MTFKNVLISTLLSLATSYFFPAFAENADREKPINIEADRGTMDDKTSTAVFEGNVVLTQGTLIIRADELTVIQENDEFKKGIAIGNLAYFKQKREGYEEFIEGEAERIEYNAITDELRMFRNAKLWRDEDEVFGPFISYDAGTEQFIVDGSTSPSNPGRVKAIIKPKSKDQ
jgi:lipopolysaccharide export system protein LptA